MSSKKTNQNSNKKTIKKDKILYEALSSSITQRKLSSESDLVKVIDEQNVPIIENPSTPSILTSFFTFIRGLHFSLLHVKVRQKIEHMRENYRLIARLMKYLAEKKTIMIFGYISVISTGLAQTKMPQVVSYMIDSIILKQSQDALISEAKNFLILAVIYSVSEFFWAHLFDILALSIKNKLKMEVYSTIIQRETGFFDKKTINDIMFYINNQIDVVQGMCTQRFSSFGRNFVQLISSAWMLTSISYRLLSFLFIIVPAYLVLSLAYSRISEKIHGKEKECYLKTNQKVTEVFQNIKIVKANSTEDYEIEEHKNLLTNDVNHSLRVSIASSANASISGLIANFSLLAIIYIGMSLVNVGDVTPGTLSSFIVYAIAVSVSFKDLSFSYIRIKDAFPMCKELFQLLDESSKIPYKGGKVLPNFKGNIEFKNVWFSYPNSSDVKILKNLSFSINPGESVAFVGMSGGGKSTIISLLLRAYDVTQGDIKLDGTKLDELDLYWVHQQIGYVSQEPILFSGTIEENITYGLKSYTKENLMNAIEMANAEFIFDEVLFPNSLKTDIGERGNRLSGGQKQRLAIARALIREPKLLIFDEATSNLDTNSEYEVQKALDNLITDSGITTVTIAHRLSTIVKCKTIYVIANGEIAEKGNHKDLIARKGIYKSLVENQLKGH